MAVYCPVYDSISGWYIIAYGPKGFYKQKIKCPISYYKSMGVEPPIGFNHMQEGNASPSMSIQPNTFTDFLPLPPFESLSIPPPPPFELDELTTDTNDDSIDFFDLLPHLPPLSEGSSEDSNQNQKQMTKKQMSAAWSTWNTWNELHSKLDTINSLEINAVPNASKVNNDTIATDIKDYEICNEKLEAIALKQAALEKAVMVELELDKSAWTNTEMSDQTGFDKALEAASLALALEYEMSQI